jgi:hypothetical protein
MLASVKLHGCMPGKVDATTRILPLAHIAKALDHAKGAGSRNIGGWTREIGPVQCVEDLPPKDQLYAAYERCALNCCDIEILLITSPSNSSRCIATRLRSDPEHPPLCAKQMALDPDHCLEKLPH